MFQFEMKIVRFKASFDKPCLPRNIQNSDEEIRCYLAFEHVQQLAAQFSQFLLRSTDFDAGNPLIWRIYSMHNGPLK